MKEYTTPTPKSGPQGITSGPDGNLWFAETAASKVARLEVASGVISEWTMPKTIQYGGNCSPRGITNRPDGAVWFTEFACNMIARINSSGQITEFSLSSATAQPLGITVGPDGALWFTEGGNYKICQAANRGALRQ